MLWAMIKILHHVFVFRLCPSTHVDGGDGDGDGDDDTHHVNKSGDRGKFARARSTDY